MKLYYDFHIHSCLSPCGDDDMTPFNLVNMASLLGLQAIALTDHNTCANCPAAAAAAQKAGLLFLPGMELCTAEEAHVVCLFPTVEAALAFETAMLPLFPFVANRPKIFGEQWVYGTDDEVIGTEKRLLTAASAISVDSVDTLVKKFDGAAFPAHVDRPSYSITAALGDIPPLGFGAAEITAKGNREELKARYPLLNTLLLLQNSDAHCLEDIQEPVTCLEVAAHSPAAVIAAINRL